MDKTIVLQLKEITKVFGELAAVDHVSLEVNQGEFYTLLGPSGCGKTTALRMVSGLERPTSGEVWINGKNVEGVPSWKRECCMIFQRLALFPHMNVGKNVAYGLERQGMPQEEIREKVKAILDLVRLPGFEERRMHTLSGGEQQRVALARSLVLEPSLLLLDEPLASLDRKLRDEMTIELSKIQRRAGVAFLYVTHDQEMSMSMSDRIAVMDKGRIRQIGPPQEIYNYPQGEFVAQFIGESNFLEGKVEAVKGDMAVVAAEGLNVVVENAEAAEGQDVILLIRPERIRLGAPGKELRNSFEGIVEKAAYKGSHVFYEIRLRKNNKVFKVESREAPVQEGETVLVSWAEDSARPLKKESRNPA